MIKAGADVNEKGPHGQTALMWATCGGHLEVVQELINSGADVKLQHQSNMQK